MPLVPVIIGVEEAQHLAAHVILSESFFVPSMPVAYVWLLWFPLFTTLFLEGPVVSAAKSAGLFRPTAS